MFEVLDKKVLLRDGCYSLVKIWLPGHVRLPRARYLPCGLTGKPETEVTMDVIKPMYTFDVVCFPRQKV